MPLVQITWGIKVKEKLNLGFVAGIAGFVLLPSISAFAEERSATAVQFGEVIAEITGFDGPESVRYDPDQDVYFVANFSGDVSGDANAFVSRVSADGVILAREFMVGTSEFPFHGGRGMYIVGRSLWVADAGGIHEFDRYSGEHLGFVDFADFEPGFLNDIVQAGDGRLYVTDTGTSRLFVVSEGVVSVAAETPFQANGITLNPQNGRLVLVPWSGSSDFVEWDTESGSFHTVGSAPTGGNYDGVEFVNGSIVTASQSDQSLHVMAEGNDGMAVELAGRPADIGVDTRRMRIAVPFVGLDRVDILPIKRSH